MSCPKCGSTSSRSVPTYVSPNPERREHPEEYLLYLCRRCGYETKELTVDQKERRRFKEIKENEDRT